MQSGSLGAYAYPYKKQIPVDNADRALTTQDLQGLLVVSSNTSSVLINLPFANTIRAGGFFQILALNGATNPVTIIFRAGDSYNGGQTASIVLDKNDQSLLILGQESSTTWLTLLTNDGIVSPWEEVAGVGGKITNVVQLVDETNEVEVGVGSVANREGAIAYANGIFEFAGDAQQQDVTLRTETNANSSRELTLDGLVADANTTPSTSNRIILEDHHSYNIIATLVGRDTSAGPNRTFALLSLFANRNAGAATVTIVSNTVTSAVSGLGGFASGVDAGAGALQIVAVPGTANQYRWTCRVRITKVRLDAPA